MRRVAGLLWVMVAGSACGGASAFGWAAQGAAGRVAVVERPAAWAQAGSGSSAGEPGRAGNFVIHLEQKKGDQVVAVHAGHVFDPGDVVRFRVTAQGFEGYLYVIDLGTSGMYSTLYPAEGGSGAGTGGGSVRETGGLIHAGQDALVPAVEDGWFQVEGPAGFDVLYFLVSPKPLDVAPAPAGKKAEGALPDSLKPRCDDKVFQARGECVDDRAGPTAAGRDIQLPAQITAAAGNASRDLVYEEDAEDHSVKAAAPLDKPVVYVFKLAHH